ncbi:OmpA family protein [Xylanimonas ulmi]
MASGLGGRLGGACLLIEGHTDDVGAEEHNLDLARRRAEASARRFVDNGVDRSPAPRSGTRSPTPAPTTAPMRAKP